MNKSLNRAATIVSTVMIALVVICGAAGLWASRAQTSALREQGAAADLARNHMNADMMHDAIRADVLAVLAARNPETKLSLKDNKDALAEDIKTLQAAIKTDIAYEGAPEVDSATARLDAPVAAYTREADQITDLAASNPAAADGELPKFFAQFRALETEMEQTSNAIEKHAHDVADHAESLSFYASILLVVTLLASVGAMLAATVAVRKHLVRPLLGLVEAIRGLAAGNLDAQVPAAEREDELGQMAKAMSAFRDQLKAAQAAKQVQTDLIVGSIGTGLGALAQGDLTAEVTADLDGPFASLKTNFNDAVASLRTVIGSVLESTATIRTGAGEIAQASEDLARRTESNAASLEETSAALAQIDGRLKASASASQQTVERADQALATVDDGRSTAGEAVGAMSRVSDSAKGIDTVIEGLDKIAFQPRVLAMNAAVEAGRAGEAGRGVAAVADLVSALARRAEEEAKRARDQLTVTQTEIVSAVDAVQKVDGSLQRISEDVGEVHGLLGRMASDNQAQATAITQISAAVGVELTGLAGALSNGNVGTAEDWKEF